MKKTILSVLLLSALLLTGCDKMERIMDILLEKETTETAAGPADPGTQTPVKPDNGGNETSAFSDSALQDIINMKITITEICDKNLGVMFLGTCEGKYDDVMQYIRNMGGGMDTSYPWLMEIPRENFLSGEGMELYAVVPGEDWKMTVYRYGMDPDNDYLPARGEKLYEGGEPVLLQGNISDIVPGFEIVLQRGGDSISYQPCLSLENGRLQQSAGVQDFSPYDLVMPGGMTEFEALAGYWECAYVDPNGNENMLYLTIAEDGGLSYSYGLANSEMAEVFGGSWDMADDCLSFHLTGGILDTELGYVAEPYEFHSLYAYTWGDIGNVLTLRLREDTALLYGTENTDLTFYCVGTVGDFFDPLAGILPAEMDPSLCAGNWFSGHYDDEGYEMVMCLSLLEDGTATYMHGYMSSDSGEWYEGTWTADKEGKLILDMDGGWLDPVEEGEKQHFRGVFRWDLYGRQLGLTHEEGTPLAAGKENWFFGFMPFDYSPYDGEWVAHTDTETCTLSLYSNGEVLCSVVAADGTLKAYYEGWWSVTEAMELELSMLLMEGDGERTVNCLYAMEWMEYPFRLHIQCPAGSYALTDTMAQNGGETFSWIDPDAVG